MLKFFNINTPLTQFLLFLLFFIFAGISDLFINFENSNLINLYIRDILVYFGFVIGYSIFLYYLPKTPLLNPLNFYISALIIFAIIHPTSPLYLKVLAVFIWPFRLMFLKHKGIQIFNPAVFALAFIYLFSDIASFVSGTESSLILSWWGADMTFQFLIVNPVAMYLVAVSILTGFIYFSYKFKKHVHSTIFVLSYLALSNANIFFNQNVFSLENSLILFKAVFFAAFVMLAEPKTSPTKTESQIALGINTGISLFILTNYSILNWGDPIINTLILANIFSFVLKIIVDKKQASIQTSNVSLNENKI